MIANAVGCSSGERSTHARAVGADEVREEHVREEQREHDVHARTCQRRGLS